jgi:hypothetical protein
MIEHSGSRRAAAFLLLAAAPSLLPAVDTHVWEQSEQADFVRGTAKNLSIRSDGRLTLAPQFKELDSTTVPYLWAVAQDSKGVLYYAGGAPTGASTKVYALAPGQEPRVFADIAGLEIHALAIDAQDRGYAAILPDAKIYRLDKSGKAQLFFDAKCKYIWAMAFDKSGALFVATGDAGLIYKVAPDGTGARFFDTGETHARSMTLDSEGNLIVGTEPSGLILRVTPAGKGFVLYQANKREVTAVAERGGVIYAAAVGNKPPGGLVVTSNGPVAPASQTLATSTAAPHAVAAPLNLPPPVNSLSASVSGGSEVYRIEKDGFAEKLWGSASEVVYAIAFDAEGRPLIGTGNKGVIHRIDLNQESTNLLNVPPTQVTSFLEGRNGVVYATTGNVGNLYAIGPGTESEGTFESEVLDANEFATWGKIHITSEARGGAIGLETRSGNVNHPESNWTPWSKVEVAELGGQIHSQPARFLQYRLTLNKSAGGESPEVSLIDIAYLPKNVAPKVLQIEAAPFNYRLAPSSQVLERSIQPSGSPTSITLPAVGQKRSPLAGTDVGAGAATLQYSKGFLTVRWNATDSNGDLLNYKVELRSANDSVWRVLKDKLLDRYYAFDTTSFPDGKYVVRITASDAPANTPSDALTGSLESDSFIIDNTPPVITIDTAAKNGVLQTIKFTAKDALSWIDKAEYSVDGGDWISLVPDNLVTDSQALNYTVGAKEGQMISIRVYDENDNVAAKQMIAK